MLALTLHNIPGEDRLKLRGRLGLLRGLTGLILLVSGSLALAEEVGLPGEYLPPLRDLSEYRYPDQGFRRIRIPGATEEDTFHRSYLDQCARLLVPVPVQAGHVESARVVARDDELLKRDFPLLRSHPDWEIDEWLRGIAVLAETQLRGNGDTHTPFLFSGLRGHVHSLPRVAQAFRPFNYGRALVFALVSQEGKTIGLIDAKGAGADNPQNISHKNGLASAAEALREFVYEKLIHKIFQVNGLPVTTVGIYAVLDLDFDILEKTESGEIVRQRAGLILRQAHARPDPVWINHPPIHNHQYIHSAGLAPGRLVFKIEQLLRLYGVTSAGARDSDQPVEAHLLNIQTNRDYSALVDHGAFLSLPSFDRPVYALEDAYLYRFEEIPFPPLARPGDPGFVQPDAERRVSFEKWGSTWSGIADPRFDNPWIWAEDIFRGLQPGQPASRASIDQYVKDMADGTEIRPLPPSVLDSLGFGVSGH